MEEERYSEFKLNSTMEKVGMKNRYQIITLLIIFCLYGTSEFLAIALPLMEISPYINYTNDLNVTINTQVTYELCKGDLKKYNYTIDYEKSKSSLITDFEAYCSENKTAFIGSSLFFGVMIGSFISYFFSDKIGRKKTALIFSFFYSFNLLAFLLINNLYLLYALLFLAGLFYSITILSSLLLLNEVLDIKLTAIFTTIIYNAYPVFGAAYSILFRDLNNWRAIFIIIGIIHVICVLLLFFFVEESPRFYFVKNEIENMEDVLLRISVINGKDPVEIIKNLRVSEVAGNYKGNKSIKDIKEHKGDERSSNLFDYERKSSINEKDYLKVNVNVSDSCTGSVPGNGNGSDVYDKEQNRLNPLDLEESSSKKNKDFDRDDFVLDNGKKF